MNSDFYFQKYAFANIKMNLFQVECIFIHLYELNEANFYIFQSKNNINFSVIRTSQFKILNRKCSFSIQLNSIEFN